MTPARTPMAEAVALSEWARAPAYWGPYRDDDYIFRRDFSLPRAANYDGSELSLGIIADARPIPIYLNGVDVGARYDDSFLRGPIGSRLRPGRNVIAIEVNGSSGRFMRCAGTHAIVDFVASMVPALAVRDDMLIVPCAAIATATSLLPDLNEVVDQGDQRLAQPTRCDTHGPCCHRAVWGILTTPTAKARGILASVRLRRYFCHCSR